MINNLITIDDLNYFITKNVEVYLDGVLAAEGSSVVDVEFKVVCLDGYNLVVDGNYLEYSYLGYSSGGDLETIEVKQDLILNGDYTVGTVQTVKDNLQHDQLDYYNIVLDTIQNAPPPSITGTNGIYFVSNSIVGEVNKNRFVSDTVNKTSFDYGVYILSLINLPFDLPSGLIGESRNIYLADRDTTVGSDTITDELIFLDLGFIEVPNKYGNLLDYSDNEAILHLPYSKPVTLDLNYVVGEKISIQYIVSAYTGEATINIYSSKLNTGEPLPNVNIVDSVDPFGDGSLVAKYQFNNNPDDTTGNYDGMLTDDVTYIPSIWDMCAVFGVGSKFSSVIPPMSKLSVSLFFTQYDDSRYSSIVSLGYDLEGSFTFYVTPLNTLFLKLTDTGDNYRIRENIELNNRYHIVLILESGSVKCYVDGVLEFSENIEFINPFPTLLECGYSTNYNPLNTWFSGEIDQLEIYNRALTAVEVGNLQLQLTPPIIEFEGEVINTTSTKIGVNVPYITDSSDLSIKNSSVEVNGYNGVTTPYIEFIEVDKILADGFYTIPVIDESVLTGQTGFIRIEEINLKSNASKQNKELLISLLKEGVIIND